MASRSIAPIEQYTDLSGLDNLISKVDSLVSVPDIYYRLEATIEDPAASTADYANLLASDTDLCARLLRMANSAFYSFPVTVDRVDRAISLVGLRQIRELVLATSILQGFNQHPSDVIDIHQFWKHSIAVGVGARAIMRRAGMAGSDNCYIPGLLHEIGKLVIALCMPSLWSECNKLQQQRQCRMRRLENEMLGYDHALIGGRLLQHWKVPESIYDPVLCHHDPLSVSEYTAINCSINLADDWVNHHGYEVSDFSLADQVNQAALDFMKLEMSDIEENWSTTETEIKDITRQFLSH